jgi:membrane protease YdiL (CAAX protease family)
VEHCAAGITKSRKMVRPVLNNASAPVKLLVFVAMTCMSWVLFNITGTLVCIPLYDVNIFLTDNILNELNQPQVVSALKLLQVFSVLGVFVAPPVLFAFFVSDDRGRYLYLSKCPSIAAIALVFILIFFAAPTVNWMQELNKGMVLPDFLSSVEGWMKSSEKETAEITAAFMRMASAGDLFVNLTVVAFLAAFGEEIFFRGVMQRILGEWFRNTQVAIWVTAFLFSFFHLQFYGFLPRMMIGVLLGYLLLWGDSLWLCVWAHFVNNATAVVLEYLAQREIIDSGVSMVGSAEGETIFVIISGLFTGLFILLVYQVEKKKESKKI